MSHTRGPSFQRNLNPLRDYVGLSNWSAHSYYRAYLAEQKVSPRAPIYKKVISLLRMGFVRAGLRFAKALFAKRRGFQDYDYRAGESGVFPLKTDPLDIQDSTAAEEVRLSLAGDWGTGTHEAAAVAEGILQFKPHFTIHLGDVYYTGDATEINEHCLNTPARSSRYETIEWPHGSLGSYALNGDHQMHGNGDGFYRAFLPTLGIGGSRKQIEKSQKASFFCLRNRHWMIIGLDTGYNSVGLSSIFSMCKLEDVFLDWLHNQVHPKDFAGAIILLGHHPYCSAFERGYVRPATQLKGPLGDRCVLWFWGHEHRFAIYGKYKSAAGIPAFGRCIGHGGMPVSLGNPNPKSKAPLVLYDNRRYGNLDGAFVGFNGFANLTFVGSKLKVEYFSLPGFLQPNYSLLLRETWECKAGDLHGASISMIEDGLAQANPDLNAAQR
jgi:hypothetical protein